MAAPFPSPVVKWHDNSYQSISPTRPELSAKGKTVFIAGGGTGIGAETAKSFAKAGATQIGIIGRRNQPLLETKAAIEKTFPGVEVFTASADVTKKEQVDTAFAAFAKRYGKVNVLIAAAAVTGPHEAVGEDSLDHEKFLWAVNTNVQGTLNVADAFLHHAAADAVVVEINSNAAYVNFAPKFHAYSVAKLAVFRLWDCVAFAHPKLSIFHTQPGVVDTAMNKEAGGVKAMGFEDHGRKKSEKESRR